MSAQALARHQKNWEGKVGHAADEVGMAAPKQLHHINARTQAATVNKSVFGGLYQAKAKIIEKGSPNQSKTMST